MIKVSCRRTEINAIIIRQYYSPFLDLYSRTIKILNLDRDGLIDDQCHYTSNNYYDLDSRA